MRRSLGRLNETKSLSKPTLDSALKQTLFDKHFEGELNELATQLLDHMTAHCTLKKVKEKIDTQRIHFKDKELGQKHNHFPIRISPR